MDIIFDLDGTMWDSTEKVRIAWNNVLKRQNSSVEFTQDFFASIMGKTNKEIEEMIEQKYSICDKNFLTNCQDEELVVLRKYGANIFPYVLDTIKELSHENNLFIASNCQDGYIDCFLDVYGLRKYFVDYICPSAELKNKTDIIRALKEKHNIKDFYYIGDTVGDYVACQNSGGEFIFASYGFGNVDCEKKINSFDELLKFFKN